MSKLLRVLLVEDSENDALLILRQLRHNGYKPVHRRVCTAAAMSAALDEQGWDIVISDFVMPQFDGLGALGLLKQKGLDIPFIIVSGRIGEETAVTAMKAGACDYIMKSNLKRLVPAIERELVEADNRRERKITEERLRMAESGFRQVITSSADGVVIIDKDGTILFVNPAAEVFFCRTAEQMVGTLFGFPLVERIEIEVVKDNDKKATAEMRIVDTDWEGTPVHLATLRDITRRKQVVLALQQSEARLRLLLEQVPCILWTMDTNLRFTSSRGAGLAAVKLLPDEIVGMTLAEYLKVDDLDFAPYVAHRQALQGTPVTYEAGWAGRTLYSRIEPLHDVEGRIVGVAGVALDITERKEAEDKLRSLSRQLVEIQEDERRSIACELHDEIGQSLTGLKFLMEEIADAKKGDTGRCVAEAQQLLKELLKKVRELSLDLRPAMLDDLGLLPTLQWYFERYTNQTGVRINFRHVGLRRVFPPNIGIAAYRIVQEALTNVARHSHAGEAMVCVHADQGSLLIEVEDRGVGFDPGKLSGDAAIGLSGMNERVLALNGTLTIESTPGTGTYVAAQLPLPRGSTRKTKQRSDHGNKHRVSR